MLWQAIRRGFPIPLIITSIILIWLFPEEMSFILVAVIVTSAIILTAWMLLLPYVQWILEKDKREGS